MAARQPVPASRPAAGQVADPEPPYELNWDFRQSYAIGAIGWPSSNNDDIWFLEEPHLIHLRFADGETGNLPIERATVWRTQARIRAIMFSFEDATLAHACDDARSLGRNWGIRDFSKLDSWESIQSRDPTGMLAGTHHCSVGGVPLDPTRGIEVKESYDLEQTHPWLCRLNFGIRDSGSSTNPAGIK